MIHLSHIQVQDFKQYHGHAFLGVATGTPARIRDMMNAYHGLCLSENDVLNFCHQLGLSAPVSDQASKFREITPTAGTDKKQLRLDDITKDFL